MLLTEYPFNMIPINARILPVCLSIYLIWGVVSIVYEELSHNALYSYMSWRQEPIQATVVYLCGLVFEVIIFFALWALTEKVKLPRYMERVEIQTVRLADGLTY